MPSRSKLPRPPAVLLISRRRCVQRRKRSACSASDTYLRSTTSISPARCHQRARLQVSSAFKKGSDPSTDFFPSIRSFFLFINLRVTDGRFGKKVATDNLHRRAPAVPPCSGGRCLLTLAANSENPRSYLRNQTPHQADDKGGRCPPWERPYGPRGKLRKSTSADFADGGGETQNPSRSARRCCWCATWRLPLP
jgi:hypothetical protein